eukprot:gene2702-16137_t
MFRAGGGPPPPLSKRIGRGWCEDIVASAGQPLSEAEFQNAITLLDTDGNGKLSYSEFKAWWSKADRFEMLKLADSVEEEGYAEFMEAAVTHFKHFDGDQSGAIDKAEFVPLFENLQDHGYPMSTLEQTIKDMDTDGDGNVNLTEYCKYLSKLKFGK